MSAKKTVYYLRHFEALHNVPPYDYSLRDPELSPFGQSQAASTWEIIEKIPSIDLIVCSPLTRTLQTYLLLFHQRTHIPLIIHPDLQEVCSEICDVGSPLNILREKFPSLSKSLTTFEETFGANDWLEKQNPESLYSPKQVKTRAKRFHQWLINRPETTILVISHNLMLAELLSDPTRKEKLALKNGELKTMEYSS